MTTKAKTTERAIWERKNSSCNGRFADVNYTHEEFEKIIKKEKLTTKTAMILFLYGENIAMNPIAKFLNLRQQHVRNTIENSMKKKDQAKAKK